MCSRSPTPAWPVRSPAPASATSPCGTAPAASTRRGRPRSAPTTRRSPPPTRRWRRTSPPPCGTSPTTPGRRYRSRPGDTSGSPSTLVPVGDAGSGGGGLRQRWGGAVDAALVVVEVDGETDGTAADRGCHSVGLQPRGRVLEALRRERHGDDGTAP